MEWQSKITSGPGGNQAQIENGWRTLPRNSMECAIFYARRLADEQSSRGSQYFAWLFISDAASIGQPKDFICKYLRFRQGMGDIEKGDVKRFFEMLQVGQNASF